MLSSLSIKDVVLIDKLELTFSKGLGVLTGETGAGKSILLDSLGLAIGARAETSLVRKGAEQLSVTAIFDVPKEHEVFNILKEFDIPTAENEIVLRRSITNDGRSKAYVNDQAVSVKALKDIGTCLVEVHGQFETYGLLNSATHRRLLDDFGGLKGSVTACKAAFLAWQTAKQQRLIAENNQQKAKSDEAFLIHSIEEIKKLNIQDDEEKILTEKRSMLMNSEKSIEGLNSAYNLIAGQSEVNSSLQKALSIIEKIGGERFRNIAETIERASIEVEEATNLLELASSEVDLDPRYLEEVEERLFTLKGLARKHEVAIDFLPELLKQFEARLSLIDGGEARLLELRQKEEEARSEYMKQSKILSEQRKEKAVKLDNAVNLELPPLRLEKARFKTEITELLENEWHEYGKDKVAFLVSTNPNAELQPIAKIASGGELARLTLALKVNLAVSGSVATIVFDEVDSGIGGAAASAVGERLKKLSKKMQVLVVTHSPQVAAVGDSHFRVNKMAKDIDAVITTVVELGGDDKQEEIARMLAGTKVTDEARAAAKALIFGN